MSYDSESPRSRYRTCPAVRMRRAAGEEAGGGGGGGGRKKPECGATADDAAAAAAWSRLAAELAGDSSIPSRPRSVVKGSRPFAFTRRLWRGMVDRSVRRFCEDNAERGAPRGVERSSRHGHRVSY